MIAGVVEVAVADGGVGPFQPHQRRETPGVVGIVRDRGEVLPLPIGQPLRVVGQGEDVEEPLVAREVIQLLGHAQPIGEERLTVQVAPEEAVLRLRRESLDRVALAAQAGARVAQRDGVHPRLSAAEAGDLADGAFVSGERARQL